MSDWDGTERRSNRHNPDICEMRFTAIEKKAAENYATLEAKLDAMSVRDERTSALVTEVRQKIFNGYSERLVSIAHSLEKVDKRMQWMTGIFVTFVVGLLTALLLYVVVG